MSYFRTQETWLRQLSDENQGSEVFMSPQKERIRIRKLTPNLVKNKIRTKMNKHRKKFIVSKTKTNGARNKCK